MKSGKTCIILFGSSGFIGGYLYKQFHKFNHYNISGYTSKTCNLFSLNEIINIFNRTDQEFAVIITSAINRHKANSYDSMTKNMLMVENICKALPKPNVKQIIFMSTIDVYGVNIGENETINETLSPNPSDYYSVSKVVSEYLLKMYCKKYSIPLLILRLPGVYGYGDDFKSTIGIMIKRSVEEKEIVVFGEGKNMRDFVYVNDLYYILSSAIQNQRSGIVNVASGKSLSINEIAKLIQKLNLLPVKIKYLPEKIGFEKRVKNLMFDSSVFKAEFKNIKMTGLKSGISDYIHSIKDDQERNSLI